METRTEARAVQAATAAAPAVTLYTRKTLTRSTTWLRANCISVVFFALAAKVTYTTTMVVLTTGWDSNDPRLGGFMLTFALYMIGACRLGNAEAARVARTLPFVGAALWLVGYVAWAVVVGETDYPNYLAMLFMAFVVLGFGAFAYDGLDGLLSSYEPSAARERKTTVGNSKFADPRQVQHYDILKRHKES